MLAAPVFILKTAKHDTWRHSFETSKDSPWSITGKTKRKILGGFADHTQAECQWYRELKGIFFFTKYVRMSL